VEQVKTRTNQPTGFAADILTKHFKVLTINPKKPTGWSFLMKAWVKKINPSFR